MPGRHPERMQDEILHFIRESYRERGVTPTIHEIAQHVGRSSYTINTYLIRLKNEGLIEREYDAIHVTAAGWAFRVCLGAAQAKRQPRQERVNYAPSKLSDEEIDERINRIAERNNPPAGKPVREKCDYLSGMPVIAERLG